MGVFRSQTPRALINADCNSSCPVYTFHLGRIRPVSMPVSGLFFFLTADCLFRFLLFSIRFNLVFSPGYIPDLRSMAFLPDTILSPDSFPFLSVPNAHPPILPCILHSEILYQSISPSTITHICRFHSYNLIFLLSLCRSPFLHRLLEGSPVSGRPFMPSKCLIISVRQHNTSGCTLSAIYRCVARSCHKVIKQNLYQRKSSCIPHLSKYSCLAFSRSSSVGAVLKVV